MLLTNNELKEKHALSNREAAALRKLYADAKGELHIENLPEEIRNALVSPQLIELRRRRQTLLKHCDGDVKLMNDKILEYNK